MKVDLQSQNKIFTALKLETKKSLEFQTKSSEVRL